MYSFSEGWYHSWLSLLALLFSDKFSPFSQHSSWGLKSPQKFFPLLMRTCRDTFLTRLSNTTGTGCRETWGVAEIETMRPASSPGTLFSMATFLTPAATTRTWDAVRGSSAGRATGRSWKTSVSGRMGVWTFWSTRWRTTWSRCWWSTPGSGPSSASWSWSRWYWGSPTWPRSAAGSGGTSTRWRGRGQHTATRRSTFPPSHPRRQTSENMASLF